MRFPRNLAVILIIVCQGIQTVFTKSDDKTVYIVHYRQGRSIVPVIVEIDYEQKTEYVFNLSPKSGGKSVTFYDFREGAVAYKYLNLEQCFISHFTEETLEAGTKMLQKLENKVVNESSLVTLWASNRALPSKLLLRLAGKRIAEFCRSSASFLVTSSEIDESFKLRRKRDTTAEEKQQKDQFTHRSYGHYGHQSQNYAHYGHETYTGGQISSAGEAVQKMEHYQTPRDSLPEAPATGISQPFLPPGSHGYTGGSGVGGSEGFALRTGYEGGYQINQPFGLRAGSQYRGALSTQGQYATRSRTSAPGVSAQMSGLATRGDTVARIPGTPVGPWTDVTTSSIPGIPSTRPIDERPRYQEPRDFRRDTQPGFPSAGILTPSDRTLATRRPGLPGYPATTVTQPGRPLDTAEAEYLKRQQPSCCQTKIEVPAAVPSDISRMPTIAAQPGYPTAPQPGYPTAPQPGFPIVLQPGYPTAAQPSYPTLAQPGYPIASQPGYPTAGISHTLNVIKPPDYRPPPSYPSPGILTPVYRIPQTTHPGLLPAQTAITDDSPSVVSPGQAPCCQPKIQPPGIVTTGTGSLPKRDIQIQPYYPRLPSPHLDFPSAIIPPPGYLHSATIQPSYPSPGAVPCCQPKVQPPGPYVTAADIPAVRDVRLQPGYTETTAARFDHRPPETAPQPRHPYSVMIQPGYSPSGVAPPSVEHPGSITQVTESRALPTTLGHPSQRPVQQVYPVTPATPGASLCCQPKVEQPDSTFTGVPSIPGRVPTEIKRPDYEHPGWKYPDYPPSTYIPRPDHPPSSIQQPAYPSPVAPQPGFPSRDTEAVVGQPGYPLYPDRPLGPPQPTYVSPPGILHPAYPSRDAQHPAYPSLVPPRQTYPSPGAPQPPTAITPPDSIFPGSQPGYLPPGTIYPARPGYPGHPHIAGGGVAHPEHLLPRRPETYPPGTQLPSVQTVLPGSIHPVTGEGTLIQPGQLVHPRNGVISVRSKDDTAVSQTQVQTGYEGTAAEATSIGRQGGLGAQTQVQGGYTGNGSFSAQAQSGFTGGVTQSQVRGGKQGGLSGSSAQVERVGSAQSQVQVGRPSGAATGTAQGRFSSGVTQVQAQSGKSGGSAGAQAQSMGTSSSQVQVNVADGEVQAENGFQGGVSASVSGGYFGGQAHTQLQGGYDSGRIYVATAQGGFDSTSEFRGSVPGVGTIQGMLVRPLNGRLQPPTGAAGAEYMQPSVTGVLGLPQDHTSRPADQLRFRPSAADRVYRFPNGSVRTPVNGIHDQVGISRTTEDSRRLFVPSVSQLPGDGMIGIPGAVDISAPGQQTHLRYPGLDENARRSSVPAIPSTMHRPAESSQPVQLNGMLESGVFRPAHPAFVPQRPFVPGGFPPSGQRLDTEIRPEGILQPSTRIPGPSEIPGSVPIPVDFTGKPAIPNGYVPGRIDSYQPVPDLLHPDRTTQMQPVWPAQPSALFPYDQQPIIPPQETARPSHVPATAQPIDGPIPSVSRNISRDTSLHLPSTPPHTPFPTSDGVPDCCKPKRDWRTRCCQSRKFHQNGIRGGKPRCCSSKHPDEGDEKFPDGDSDFDDDAEDTDSCRIVKAVCYIVYKPNGRARVCKPTGTRGC